MRQEGGVRRLAPSSPHLFVEESCHPIDHHVLFGTMDGPRAAFCVLPLEEPLWLPRRRRVPAC